ncbi:MAG TPA: ParB/RepB/Spo0J family partition protein [Thermoanaerobaculia bacterium]|nr:ParB/RepB/Spo0J family partition protein [Thermoanaerobaculia bacterium]
MAQSDATRCQSVLLTQLRESPLNPRKHYDEAGLNELAASIADRGILQPLLVRRIEDEKTPYEIVAGHRRYQAAKIAKLTSVPVIVHEFTDREVRQVQLIENAQRVDLSPLEEAEAYAALRELGLSTREIAQEVKKKPSYVAARLTLTALPEKVKKELAAGVITAEHAELIGLIPNAELQEQALKRIIVEHPLEPHFSSKVAKGAVPIAKARRIVETEFMTVLENAPFDTADPTLSPLGACAKCPFRSGNDRDLFGNVQGKNVCTNLADYRLKIENHLKQLREQGFTVLLTPREVKEVFPFGNPQVADGYVDMEAKCADDPKSRTYDQLLATEPKRSTVFAHVNGRLRRIYPKAQLAAALDSSGHEFLRRKSERPATNDAERQARQQQKLDRAVRVATLAAFAAAMPKAKLGAPEWIDLLASIVIEEKGWQLEDVLPRHGFAGKRDDLKGNCEAIARKLVAKMNDGQKRAFVIDALVHAWAGPNADAGKRAVFAKVIAQLGVDAKMIEKQVRADFAAKAGAKPKPKASNAAPKGAVRPAAKVVRARA